MKTGRREFLTASLGAGLIGTQVALAQQPPAGAAAGQGGGRGGRGSVPMRKAKITKIFKSPEGNPNAMRVTPEGIWLGEQLTNNAILVDWDGKLIKTVKTESKNTSGMAVGGGYIWMAANAAPQGIFQTDMNGKTVSHRQIPLGPPGGTGGGCHGCSYKDGKLWITALRLRGILKVDAQTFAPEMMIPYTFPRVHETAWDGDYIWMVTGRIEENLDMAGVVKYDSRTGQILEQAEWPSKEGDPHGLEFHDGALYSCDAGIHPGWPDNSSASSGYVFRIDLV